MKTFAIIAAVILIIFFYYITRKPKAMKTTLHGPFWEKENEK